MFPIYFPSLFLFDSQNFSFSKCQTALYQHTVQNHYTVVLQCQQTILHVFAHLPAEHICVSAEKIECCLTGLNRKPHAEHHRADASPAESELLASIVYTSTHTQMYDIQTYTVWMHTNLPSVLVSCSQLFQLFHFPFVRVLLFYSYSIWIFFSLFFNQCLF